MPVKRRSFARRRKLEGDVVQPSTSSHVVVTTGIQIRSLRSKLGLTVHELAAQANISAGMLSKIENGCVEASVGCLESLAEALNVPITELFAPLDEKRSCTYVRAGNGVSVDGPFPKSQSYHLGRAVAGLLEAELDIVTLTERVTNLDSLRRQGLNFIYMLTGHVLYRCGSEAFPLARGDSLLFNLKDLHGPQEIIGPPAIFLSIKVFLPG